MDKFKKKNEKPREREAAPEGELCWGRNPVISLLEESPERCMKVLVSETMQPHVKTKIISLCREAGVVFQNAGQAALDRLTNGENHQGVAAYLTQAKLWDADELLEKLPAAPEPVMILLCDHVQDPHNLGAMIRSAEAAGASAVLIPKRGGCLPTGTVIKTSAGAALRVPVALTGNVAQTVRKLQEAGFWVAGLDMNGRALPRRPAAAQRDSRRRGGKRPRHRDGESLRRRALHPDARYRRLAQRLGSRRARDVRMGAQRGEDFIKQAKVTCTWNW